MRERKAEKVFLLLLLAALMLCTAAFASEETEKEEKKAYEDWTLFEQPYGGNRKKPRMNYWVYTPEQPEPGLPMVIYLHSSFGLSGKALRDGLPIMIEDGRAPKPDAVVLVPQLPGGYNKEHQWEDVFGSLIPIIEKVQKDYQVDESRISLTGYSLGGIGVWDLALADPGRYARILSIGGKVHYPVLHAVEAFAGKEVMAFTARGDKTVNPATVITFTGMLQDAGICAYHEECERKHGELQFDVFARREIQEWLWLIPSISGEKTAEQLPAD